MKRFSGMLAVALALAVATVVFAGDKGDCSSSGEDCLKKMQYKLQHQAWLGIEFDTTENGYWKINEVVPGSPAAKAGFEKGDVLLAINGVKLSTENKKAVKEAFSKLEPGSEATYVVKRESGKVKLEATLGHVPENLQAKWIQEHMSKYHPETKVASK
ncbi:MAG: PDZ domain-containing protein [Acidobacteriota bacterium]